MKAKTIKIAATVAVLVLALSGLMYTTLSEGTEYYKHVDEVMTDPAAWHDKRLQLHGFVVEKSIFRKPDTLEYIFDVQSKGKVVSARYTGVVPDTFKDGSEVVLKGRLGPHGFSVDPNGVMAKCPSKYEASKTPGARGT
jgi:cytochrome c-type biogenesis protein CcmE